MLASSLQKETARLFEQPSRESTTPSVNFKELQMKHSTPTTTSPITMSSLEIADLTGKRHNDVLRDIRSTLEQAGIDAAQFCAASKYNNNNTRTIYRLPRAECDLVISGYSVKYRWAIIQRWYELERKVSAGETAPSSRLTYEAMSKAVMSYANQYGRDAALGVLRRFGSKNLPGVPESRWAELFAVLQYAPGNPTSAQMAEERLRFGRFLLRFDPTSGQPQLSEVSKNACIIDPDNPSELQTFINEFVRFEQIPAVLQAAMNRVNLCYQAVKDKAALPAPTPEPKPRTTGRPWKDPAQAEELLKSMRFRLEEMYDFSLITPERVEELHKANVIGPRQMVKLKRLMAA